MPGFGTNERPVVAGDPRVPVANQMMEMLEKAGAPGAMCALLTPAIRAALREMTGGQVLEVRVDDPTAHGDIAAWCRLAGHELVAVVDEMPRYQSFFIRKKHG